MTQIIFFVFLLSLEFLLTWDPPKPSLGVATHCPVLGASSDAPGPSPLSPNTLWVTSAGAWPATSAHLIHLPGGENFSTRLCVWGPDLAAFLCATDPSVSGDFIWQQDFLMHTLMRNKEKKRGAVLFITTLEWLRDPACATEVSEATRGCWNQSAWAINLF